MQLTANRPLLADAGRGLLVCDCAPDSAIVAFRHVKKCRIGVFFSTNSAKLVYVDSLAVRAVNLQH